MLIGELSSKTGLSRDTIRFYEKQGLISVNRKDRRNNNYKEYSEEVLGRLLVIKRIKGFGFTLNEISEFLDLLDFDSASCDNVAQKVLNKIKLIDKKIEELQNIKEVLSNGLSTCFPSENSSENCPIISDQLLV
jgi:DNA-binding transcriptional MerR regulator